MKILRLFSAFSILLLAVGLLMATLIAGCVSSQEAAKKDPVNLVMNLWPGYSHPFIASERELFGDDELVVNISLVQEYSENVKRFVQGEFDGIFEVYSDALLQYAQGIPIKVVYAPDFSSGGDVLVGRPEIKSIADLRGKNISVEEFNSFSHIFVLDLLRRNGLTESDVTLIEVPAHDVLTALEANRIDAGHTWEPTKSHAIGEGYKLLATSEETPGIITDVLVIRSELVLSQLGFGNCLRKRLRLLPFFRSVDVGGWQPWDENGMWSGWKGKNETSWND